jgi:hypothetical protein
MVVPEKLSPGGDLLSSRPLRYSSRLVRPITIECIFRRVRARGLATTFRLAKYFFSPREKWYDIRTRFSTYAIFSVNCWRCTANQNAVCRMVCQISYGRRVRFNPVIRLKNTPPPSGFQIPFSRTTWKIELYGYKVDALEEAVTGV